MDTALKIDFVSDVSCPWCAIGLHALEHALERVAPDGITATIRLQPFELNPQMAPEGEDVVEHIGRKYGLRPEQVAANTEGIRQRGAEVGFTFGEGRRRIYNTFDAHRLLHWAGTQSPAAQLALKHALFTAYFTAGQDVSDPAVLQRCASQAGLDTAAAAAVLASDAHADAVRADEALWREREVHAVPAVVVAGRYLIQGGQPAEAFERALRKIAQREAEAAAQAGPDTPA